MPVKGDDAAALANMGVIAPPAKAPPPHGSILPTPEEDGPS